MRQQNLVPGLASRTMYTATQTRQASFFVSVPTHTHIMVARAGPTSVGPVSVYAGKANPVRVTTSKISLFGGGY